MHVHQEGPLALARKLALTALLAALRTTAPHHSAPAVLQEKLPFYQDSLCAKLAPVANIRQQMGQFAWIATQAILQVHLRVQNVQCASWVDS
jgi:hypothetical protein